MSVKIRLSRIGRKNLPAYKIVVSNTRNKRDGKFLDILGHFNPSNNPQTFEIDKKKYEEWIGKGAQVTDAVKQLVEGTYKFVPYTRQNEGDASNTESAEVSAPEEKPAEEPKEEKSE